MRVLLLLGLIAILLVPPLLLAWYGGPGPAPWCHCWHRGPWWWNNTRATSAWPYAQTTTPMIQTTTTSQATQAYPIGGPFCYQCHVTPPEVNEVWHTGRYLTVQGYVVKSAPGIAVITTVGNGTVEIYHIRFPMYCQPPQPGSRIVVSGWETTVGVLGDIHWHLVITRGGCPS